MSKLKVGRFANPDILKQINPVVLLDFMKPYKDFLMVHGMDISIVEDQIKRNIKIDFELLGSLAMQPDDSTPAEFINAAYIIGEMAKDDNVDRLMQIAASKNIALITNDDTTSADIATQLWIQDRDLIERLHAEIIVKRPRTFQYFRSDKTPPGKITSPADIIITQIENDLNEWFYKNNRGKGCRVFFFEYENEIRMLIRHGMPYKREGCIKNEQSDTIHYRPEKHDVLFYDLTDNEIAITASTNKKGQKEAYLEIIGRYLFDCPGYFLCKPKYVLDPIRDDGTASLNCHDINGIDYIKLTEVVLFFDDDYGTKKILSSADVFASQNLYNVLMSSPADLACATFEVHFTGEKKPRSVTIMPPHNIKCGRDEDRLPVNEWLKARNFVLMQPIKRESEENGANNNAEAVLSVLEHS